MAPYDLLDHQKQLVRDLVEVFKQTGVASFIYIGSDDGRALHFDTSPQRTIPMISIDDLAVLESEGMITRRLGPGDKPTGGIVRQHAVEAVAANFLRPSAAPPGTVQNYYAPVGAVHSGAGSIIIQTQNVGVTVEEVGRLMACMRAALDDLPKDRRVEAAEYVDELDSELKSGVPKQARIKSFLLGLWTVGSNVASFASSVLAIAQAYGVNADTLKRVTPGV